ncbi:hypothetical protein PG999_004725 [Apiospora kogelbergensis]|uniref:HNH endonuclease n=1 Tax=Apiospora kogelbergensis TaxID=1337665 RepID=A0AAW0R067_9PEZI
MFVLLAAMSELFTALQGEDLGYRKPPWRSSTDGDLTKRVLLCILPQTLRAIDGDIDSVAHRAKHCRPVSRGNAFWYPAPVIQAQDQDTFKWQGQHYAVHTSVLHRDLVQAGEAEHAILHQEQGDCSCCNGKILPATWEEFATSR